MQNTLPGDVTQRGIKTRWVKKKKVWWEGKVELSKVSGGSGGKGRTLRKIDLSKFWGIPDRQDRKYKEAEGKYPWSQILEKLTGNRNRLKSRN